jgi:Right handed beta helix region
MRPSITLPALLLAMAALNGAAAGYAAFYVDASASSCSDTGPGTETQPWCSISKAGAAPPDAVVLVRPGSYGDLNVAAGRTGSLTIAGETARPLLGDIAIGSSNVRIRNFLVRETGADFAGVRATAVDNFVFESNEVVHGTVQGRDCDGCVFRGNHIHDGPTYPEATEAGFACGCGVAVFTYSGQQSQQVLIENNLIDDQNGDGVHINNVIGPRILNNRILSSNITGGDHVDTIQLAISQDPVIEGNYGRDNPHGVLMTDRTPLDGPDADNRALVMRNNVIHNTIGYGVNGPPGPNGLIINNTFAHVGSDPDARGGTITQTVKDFPTHSPGAVAANNVTEGHLSCAVTCHHNFEADPFPFEGDFELPAGHAGVNGADPALAPATDQLGRERVGAPDAGARERQASASPPPPPLPPPPPPPPPPVAYHPACEPTCDQQIGDLEAQRAQLQAGLAARTAELEACRAKLAQINAIRHDSGSNGSKLNRIHTVIHEGGLCAGFSP